MINYRIYNYDSIPINNAILELYKKIFKVDFASQFDWWYISNPYGRSIGVIAIDDTNNRLAGHWAVTPLPFNLKNKAATELISLAAMVDSDYQGQGIFKNLSSHLLEYLSKNTDYDFIIGFPNDNSLYVHLNYMRYKLLRDFRFVIFKKNIPPENKKIEISALYKPQKLENLNLGENQIAAHLISVNKTHQYLKWRFCDTARYTTYVNNINNNGEFYICSRFKDKIDILLWNPALNNSNIREDFISYLYLTNPDINLVSTWDSVNFSEGIVAAKEKRCYHFCIRPLKDNLLTSESLSSDKWLFFMGDAEIF